MGVERLSGEGVVTVGLAANNSFQLSHPAIPSATFPLVAQGANGAVISAPEGVPIGVDGARTHRTRWRVLGIGSGTGPGTGGHGVGLLGRGNRPVRVRTGNVIYAGPEAEGEIQRVLKRAQARVRYCYEKELQKDTNLRGKVVESCVISAKTTQNTMGNERVGRCLNRVVKGLRFPQPRGGGSVFVTYPWVFSAR